MIELKTFVLYSSQVNISKLIDQCNNWDCLDKNKNRDLIYPPDGFVSRKAAMRTFNLNDEVRIVSIMILKIICYFKDLKTIEHLAVISEKRGQTGIFYPPEDVRLAFETNKKSLFSVLYY